MICDVNILMKLNLVIVSFNGKYHVLEISIMYTWELINYSTKILFLVVIFFIFSFYKTKRRNYNKDASPIVKNNKIDVQSVQYIMSKITKPQCCALQSLWQNILAVVGLRTQCEELLSLLPLLSRARLLGWPSSRMHSMYRVPRQNINWVSWFSFRDLKYQDHCCDV